MKTVAYPCLLLPLVSVLCTLFGVRHHCAHAFAPTPLSTPTNIHAWTTEKNTARSISHHRQRLLLAPLNLFGRAAVTAAPPPPPSASTVLQKQILELADKSALIGNLRAFLSKLSFTKAVPILIGIARAIHWEELIFYAFMGWAWVPLVAVSQKALHDRWFPRRRPFAQSYIKIVVESVAQLSRIGFAVYLVDIVKIFLYSLGFQAPTTQNWSDVVSKSLVSHAVCVYIVGRSPPYTHCLTFASNCMISKIVAQQTQIICRLYFGLSIEYRPPNGTF